MPKNTIHYRLRPLRPEAHLFKVSCQVTRPDPVGQRFSLPAWIPGSYMIRDFARHIIAIRAEADGRVVPLQKIDKQTWLADPIDGEHALTLHYEIYAWDLSVRGAHLDCSHGFVNGTSVFLRVLGQEESPCAVELQAPSGKAYADWRVATSLTCSKRTKKHTFGHYTAANYDELIDHPIEMGTFTLANFKACGVQHDVAITGRHDCDLQRLCADLKKICEWQIRFFGKPAPMENYLFLITAVSDGYGGLEHRTSTALLCSRDDLPYTGMEGLPERYKGFLGLCSHEYFHTWNVKRIKPAAFIPYDLDRENHTTLLWAFEGFTSYYDDLVLRRSGLINEQAWLDLMAKNIQHVLDGPGRLVQSLAESSFDAWSKYYRQDENTPNAVVSYYVKGALVALALDLTLRAGTNGKASLDDVMRRLWQEHGKTGIGVGEDDIQRIAEQVSGLKLSEFFKKAVNSSEDLPLGRLLKPFGIRIKHEHSTNAPTLGCKLTTEGNDARIATAYSGGPIEQAGLSAGDLLVAMNGLRITANNLKSMLQRHKPDDHVDIHAFRRDELIIARVRLAQAAPDTTRLVMDDKNNALRDEWIGNA